MSKASPRRVVSVLACGLAAFVLLSGMAAADTYIWTTQSDFQAGTLFGLNATSSPGDLILGTNPLAFVKYAGNPIMTPSASGWDSYQVLPSSIVKIGGTYHMWYSGASVAGGPYATGHATSTDEITWTRDAANPILLGSRGPHVLYEGGTYKMWFMTNSVPWSICYATSTDGTHWTNYSGNPVLKPSASGWDSYVLSSGPVLHNATGYYMWYSATADQMSWETGLATSSDGINWTKYAGNPIITVPFGGWWDAERVIPASVFPWQNGYLMIYVASDGTFTQRIGEATSGDGVHWNAYPTPALDLGPGGAWDSWGLSTPTAMPENGNITLWYGGSPSGYYSVGIAHTPGLASVGTFTSAVLDSGGRGTTWLDLNFTATETNGTSVALAARSGDALTPDATWSSWSPFAPANGTLVIPRSRYVQVQALLTGPGTSVSPVLHSIMLTYTPDQTASPTAVSPVAGSWTANASLTLQWAFRDPDPGDTQHAYRLQFSADPSFTSVMEDTGDVNGSANATSLLAPPDGTWYWRVQTQDNWGTWGPFSQAFAIHVDRTPPTVTATFGSPSVVVGSQRYINSQTPIMLTATDGPKGIGVALTAYGVDNQIPSFYTVPFRLNGTDGLHTLVFSAIDLLGNVEPLQTLSFYMDTTGPVSTIGLTPTSDGFNVAATASDAGSGVATVYVSIDSGLWAPFSQALFIDSAGDHQVRAYAVDALGNAGAVVTTTFTIANLKPYVSGSIGVLGLIVGLLFLRRPRRRGWVLGAATAAAGGAELAMAAASAGTLALAIPPWNGTSILLDGILAGLIVVLAFFAWRLGQSSPASVAPPTPPPPTPPPPNG